MFGYDLKLAGVKEEGDNVEQLWSFDFVDAVDVDEEFEDSILEDFCGEGVVEVVELMWQLCGVFVEVGPGIVGTCCFNEGDLEVDLLGPFGFIQEGFDFLMDFLRGVSCCAIIIIHFYF